MAQLSPVSDTQALLQSMLQRLKLHAHTPGEGHAHTAGRTQANAQTTGQAVAAAEGLEAAAGIAERDFGASRQKKEQRQDPPAVLAKWNSPRPRPSPGAGGAPGHPAKRPLSGQGSEVAVGAGSGRSWHRRDELTSCAFPEEEVPKWGRKQLVFSRRGAGSKRAEDPLSPRPSPQPTKERNGHGATPRGAAQSSLTLEQDFPAQNAAPPNRTKRTWADARTKRWTQNIKQRWRERHDSLEKRGKEEDEVKEENQFPPPNLQIREETKDKVSNQEEGMVQHSPITEGLSETSTSPPDYVSEGEFSLGTFNLMEEILTGPEWARFFSLNDTSQSQTSYSTRDHAGNLATETLSQISSPSQSENRDSQWDYRHNETNHLDVNMVQIFPQDFQPIDMEITELSQDQSPTTELNLNQSPTTELRLDQSRSTELSLDQSRSTELGLDQSQTTELSLDQSQTSEQSQRQPQTADSLNHSQDEVAPKFIPLLDFSFLKPVEVLDSTVDLNRKRGRRTAERGERERGRTAEEELEEGEEDDFLTTPLFPVKPRLAHPSLSPSSSLSSLQHSISQDSDSSVSMETVIKKRRMEDTRRVRFAEEVVTIPPCRLTKGGACPEESMPRPSLPNWILALRRKPKL